MHQLGKMKVYELAKKAGISNKEFLAKLRTIGIEVKSHLNVLDEADVKKVCQHFNLDFDLKGNGED